MRPRTRGLSTPHHSRLPTRRGPRALPPPLASSRLSPLAVGGDSGRSSDSYSSRGEKRRGRRRRAATPCRRVGLLPRRPEMRPSGPGGQRNSGSISVTAPPTAAAAAAT
ncbi:hypothetical protein ACP4OV_010594 [Aristida adscensionis]